MLLYTVMPAETMFDEEEAPEMVELVRGEMRLLVRPTGRATGQIVQLISGNPAHYLLPENQPGAEVRLYDE